MPMPLMKFVSIRVDTQMGNCLQPQLGANNDLEPITGQQLSCKSHPQIGGSSQRTIANYRHKW